MTYLQQELATLEAQYRQAEADLANRKQERQAELQAMADAFMQETVPMARELVMLEGAIRHIQSKLRQSENSHEPARNGNQTIAESNLAQAQRSLDLQREQSTLQRDNLGLLDRIHRKQELDDAVRDNARVLSVPDDVD
jgi:hypothetical protein